MLCAGEPRPDASGRTSAPRWWRGPTYGWFGVRASAVRTLAFRRTGWKAPLHGRGRPWSRLEMTAGGYPPVRTGHRRGASCFSDQAPAPTALRRGGAGRPITRRSWIGHKRIPDRAGPGGERGRLRLPLERPAGPGARVRGAPSFGGPARPKSGARPTLGPPFTRCWLTGGPPFDAWAGRPPA